MIVFMGTSEFAVPILETLIKNNYKIGLVVTQPDKKIGRNQVIAKSPVKELAEKYQIEVYQPKKLRNEYQYIVDKKPEILITASYGQILPQALLDKVRAFNMHGSILPKYRGGAPIQHALFNDEAKTGVTLMEMVYKMDAGDMIDISMVNISEDDNFETLTNKLSLAGSNLLLKWIDRILDNNYNKKAQDENEVTFAYNIKPEDEIINLDKPTKLVLGKIKGLSPNVGAKVIVGKTSVKIYKAIKSDIITNTKPGSVHLIDKRLHLGTQDGAIELITVQREGKKILNIKDFINGQQLFKNNDNIL